MSSNKDFINIDELFEGLKNHEEREPAGAWSKMEHVLNEKMPAGTSIASRSYKFLIPLLLIVSSISGYFIWNKTENRSFNLSNGQKASNSNHPNEVNKTNSVVIYQEEKESDYSKDELRNKDKKQESNDKIIAAIEKEKNKKEENNSNTTASSNKTIYAKSKTSNLKDFIKDKNLEKQQEDLVQAKNTQDLQQLKSNPIVTKSPILFPIETSITEPIEIQKVIEVIKPDPSKNILASNKNTDEENFNPVTEYNEETIVSNDDGQLFKEEKKSYQRYELTKKSEKNLDSENPSFILDTISIVRLQKIKYTPLNKAEIIEVNTLLYGTNSNIASVSANASNLEASREILVPLSNYKTKSKKINTIDAIKNTAGGITNYFDGSNNLALALFVGGNISLGNPGAYGMQIGLAAIYSIAERWSISGELRYGNKFFPQFNFMDFNHTYDVSKEQTQNGWLFTGKEVEETNSYVVKNSSQLNLPVYLSYNFSERLSVLGGINLAYHFPLKWNKEYSQTINNINNLQANSENPYKNSPFAVNESQDFNSKFSLGYVAGLNYELSQKLSLDARVTQSLWTNGSNNLNSLKGIYQNPTFELSLGFYLGRKNKVIYIMDRSK